MDGTLLSATETADQSWQKVCFHMAPHYHLAPEILLQAIRESYTTYKNAIQNDEKKQRRDRLDPFTVRLEMIGLMYAVKRIVVLFSICPCKTHLSPNEGLKNEIICFRSGLRRHQIVLSCFFILAHVIKQHPG
jgi:hypothetical protein